jgi:hypothetical protein
VRLLMSIAPDAKLDFSVQFSPEQVGLASRAVRASIPEKGLLERPESGLVDWYATAARVLEVGAHVYLSLLLMQAKREQRRIVNCSSDLARERKNVLVILNLLCGKHPTAEDILHSAAMRHKIAPEELRLLQEPIRRDLLRLQGSRGQKGPFRVSAPKSADQPGPELNLESDQFCADRP